MDFKNNCIVTECIDGGSLLYIFCFRVVQNVSSSEVWVHILTNDDITYTSSVSIIVYLKIELNFLEKL
jgi:hypothetical protein